VWDTDGYECAFAFACDRSSARVDGFEWMNELIFFSAVAEGACAFGTDSFGCLLDRRRSIGVGERVVDAFVLIVFRLARRVSSFERRVDERLTERFRLHFSPQTVPTCSPCCSNRNINVFTAPADAKDPTKIDLGKTTQKLEVLHDVANRADQAGMPNRVLVYCMSGQSRAPSVAVAYLMRSERRRLDDAMSALARRYPRGHRGITLKPGDYEHLEAFERELFPDG
jgi:hypothetical protein